MYYTVPLSNLVIRGSNSSPQRQDIVTIECNVTANPPANIMWMKRTYERMPALIKLNTPQASITHLLTYTPSGPVSTSVLTISYVEADDNGDYICKASNGPSSPSISANFTVCVIGNKLCSIILELYSGNLQLDIFMIMCINIGQGSVIVTPPDPSANQFGRAEFNCSVCPTLTPLFVWNFIPRAGLDTKTVANRSQSPSSQHTVTTRQKSQTLIIDNAQWSDVGVYKCIASINGTLIEAETSLDVHSEYYNTICSTTSQCMLL